ncbi:MAG: hypothetical protein HY042_04275 [Spirochaetia bacterium]|nr:hypothetical protein [Spirochaetia bacterium]
MLAVFHAASAAALQRAQKSGLFRKEYDVIVEGSFPEYLDARGFLTTGTGPVKKKRHFVPAEVEGGEKVRTEFRLVSAVKNPSLSLLRVTLHTGRLHQIRATLCSLGFPVTGDRLYGVDETLYLKMINDLETDEDRLRLRINRTALHSSLLSFPHPESGQTMLFETPMPDDMAGLMNTLT